MTVTWTGNCPIFAELILGKSVTSGELQSGESLSVEDLCRDVTCRPLDECHVAGKCDGSTGACSDPKVEDGTACFGGTCENGFCRKAASCLPGYADCNGLKSDGCEVNTQNDLSNCGNCGKICPMPANGVASCTNGQCGFSCAPRYKVCGSAYIPSASCCVASDCIKPGDACHTATEPHAIVEPAIINKQSTMIMM